MKKYALKLFVAVLLSMAMNTNAQKIKWDKKFIDTTGSQVHEFIGYDASGFYITRFLHGESLSVLEKYDYSGNRIWGKDLDIPEETGKKDYLIDNVYFMKDNIIYTVCSYDVKTAYAFKIGFDGSMSKNKTTIGDIEVKKDIWMGGGASGHLYKYRYQYTVSHDKTVLLCYYRKKDESKLLIKAMKEDLSELWEKEIELPVSGKDLVIEDAVMSGDNTYFLVASPKEKDMVSKAIIMYNHTTGKISKIDVDMAGDKYPVAGTSLKTDKTGNVIFNGLYETKQGDGVTDACFMKIDNNSGNVLASKDFAFDKDFLSQFISDKKIDKGKGIEQLKIKQIIPLDDNSIIVATEQGYNFIGTAYINNAGMQTMVVSGTRATAPGPGTGTRTQTVQSYDCNSGVIYKIGADGSLAWIKEIVKKQDMSSASATAAVANSYGISIFGNKMYLIFNDNKKNADLTAEDAEKNKDDIKTNHIDGGHSWQVLILETVDLATGDLKRKKLNDFYENGELYFYANFSLPLTDKVIVFSSTIFRAHGKDEGQFGEFTVNQQ